MFEYIFALFFLWVFVTLVLASLFEDSEGYWPSIGASLAVQVILVFIVGLSWSFGWMIRTVFGF